MRNLATWILALFCFVAEANAHGIHTAQRGTGNPEMDRWFQNQKVPGKRTSCCTTSDGQFVEEDIREGHYWARWKETQGAWIKIPDEAVINEPNKWGLPAVWWGTEDEDNFQRITVKCYVPGAKF